MGKYKGMLYPRAFRDIDSIYAYIALEKLAPEMQRTRQTEFGLLLKHWILFRLRIRTVRLENMPEEDISNC